MRNPGNKLLTHLMRLRKERVETRRKVSFRFGPREDVGVVAVGKAVHKMLGDLITFVDQEIGPAILKSGDFNPVYLCRLPGTDVKVTLTRKRIHTVDPVNVCIVDGDYTCESHGVTIEYNDVVYTVQITFSKHSKLTKTRLYGPSAVFYRRWSRASYEHYMEHRMVTATARTGLWSNWDGIPSAERKVRLSSNIGEIVFVANKHTDVRMMSCTVTDKALCTADHWMYESLELFRPFVPVVSTYVQVSGTNKLKLNLRRWRYGFDITLTLRQYLEEAKLVEEMHGPILKRSTAALFVLGEQY